MIIIDNLNYKHTGILYEYSEGDQRIKLIYNRANLGLTKFFNNDIKIAKRKYVARLDTDDIFLHQRLEKQYNFREQPYVFNYGNKNTFYR